jgi:serine/threonine protein kinase
MAETRTTLIVALGDRYRFERELGAGGMATVYLAEDVRHHSADRESRSAVRSASHDGR